MIWYRYRLCTRIGIAAKTRTSLYYLRTFTYSRAKFFFSFRSPWENMKCRSKCLKSQIIMYLSDVLKLLFPYSLVWATLLYFFNVPLLKVKPFLLCNLITNSHCVPSYTIIVIFIFQTGYFQRNEFFYKSKPLFWCQRYFF